MLLSDAIQIWRDDAGDYHIEWDASAPDTQVDLQALSLSRQPVTDSFDQVHDERRIRLSGLPGGRRHLFRLRDQHGTDLISGERRLTMQGAPNFRDFGGYRTADGRAVRWGSLYRSGQLSKLSELDSDLLHDLQLDLICDFRREQEQANDPTQLREGVHTRIVSLPIVPGSNDAYFEQEHFELGNPQHMFDFMVEVNRDLARGQGEIYATMFRELLAVPDARILVHCAAGKDRTGFAVAMILWALGVSREQILADYLLSARYFNPTNELPRVRKKYGLEDVPEEGILPMLQVHEAYLAEALRVLESEYGSIDTYLEAVLGVGEVEREELRRRYLEGP